MEMVKVRSINHAYRILHVFLISSAHLIINFWQLLAAIAYPLASGTDFIR
jgi:hypothetical protein